MGTYEVEKRVQKYIEANDMVKPGDRILIGVSGGADSVCLLQILCSLQRQMGFSVNVLHVNHGVRPEAHRDGEYVKKLSEDEAERRIAYEVSVCKIEELD